jgi:hypothetical protein
MAEKDRLSKGAGVNLDKSRRAGASFNIVAAVFDALLDSCLDGGRQLLRIPPAGGHEPHVCARAIEVLWRKNPWEPSVGAYVKNFLNKWLYCGMVDT